MKRSLIIIMILLFVIPAFAQDNDVPYFSNQDLERYRGAYLKRDLTSESPKKGNRRNEEGVHAGRYEVPYEPIAGGSRRIVVQLTINNSVTVPMALDTGATGMIISAGLAKKLGVFENGDGKLLSAIRGLGGTSIGIITVLDSVQAGKVKDDFIPTTIAATSFEGEGFDGLVGMDFMSQYSIVIDARKHVLVFEKLPPKENMPGGHDEEWWRNTFHQFASERSAWKKVRDHLRSIGDNTVTEKETGFIYDVRSLQSFADHQCSEADKLMNKLHSYAVDNVVPMEWREY